METTAAATLPPPGAPATAPAAVVAAESVTVDRPLTLVGDHHGVGEDEAALRSLAHASAPPFVVNVTGSETLAVRELAGRFSELLHRTPSFTGSEAPDALLSNATRAHALFGAPAVSTSMLLEWVAEWVQSGQPLLGKPTHFEERTGAF